MGLVAGGLAEITIPLGSGGAVFCVHGRVTARRLANQFEDKVSGPVYRKLIPVVPGWYRLQLDIKDAGDVQTIRHEELAFEVK